MPFIHTPTASYRPSYMTSMTDKCDKMSQICHLSMPYLSSPPSRQPTKLPIGIRFAEIKA